MLSRHRLKLDNLDSDGRFLLHRQFILSSDADSSEPVQLVFDDGTTTIGYKTDSVRILLDRLSGSRESSTLNGEESTKPLDTLVLFSSLSEGSEIRAYTAHHRFVGLVTVAALLATTAVHYFTTETVIHWLKLVCVCLESVLFLTSLRWSSSEGFVLCFGSTVFFLLTSLTSQFFQGSELHVTLNILTMACNGILMYQSHVLGEAHSAQAVVIKRQ